MAYGEKIENYLSGLIEVINKLDRNELETFLTVLNQARLDEKNIYIFGNGGSAATASHMVCDFNKGISWGKNPRFRFICLNDNVPTMMAYANDISYADVFVEPLRNFLKPGEVVVGISGSGNSENVIRAIDYANEIGAITVGLSGYSGGKLKAKAKYNVHVNINDMQKAEDIHIMLGHLAYAVLKDEA